MSPALPLLALVLTAFDDPAPAGSAPFDAPKFGVSASIPRDWPIAVREQEDRVFVALIPQADPDRPGVAACELGLAPENLDEYRTRIDANALRGGRPGGKLVSNAVARAGKSERLETLWEFSPRGGGGTWRELVVRVVANRQMYTYTLNVDEATYPAARPMFESLVASARYAPPDTGADRDAGAAAGPNRWVQREFKFALDLPEGWNPALAPSEVALFYANGPAHGIWSDNVLVLAEPHRDRPDLEAQAEAYPEQLRRGEPGCEVITCRVVPQGKLRALETVVRTRRGPFSMTVLERRFRGDRFDYEVKYTLESKRFDDLAPALRKSLDSFGEVPGNVAAVPGKPA